MKRLFITGATGFIGSTLCNHLAALGYELTLLVRDRSKVLSSPALDGRPALPQNAQWVEGDILKPDTFAFQLKACDALLHLAADYRLGFPNRACERKRMYQTNVEGTLRLVEAAQQVGIKKIIYASSTSAFGETHGALPNEEHQHNGIFRSYYEQSKHIAHQLLVERQKAGAPIVMATMSGVFGVGDRSSVTETMRMFIRGKLPIQPDTKSLFQLLPIEAACNAFQILVERPVEALAPNYFFTGESISTPELLQLLASELQRAEPKKVPVKRLKLLATLLDWVSRLGFQTPLTKEIIQILDGSTYTYASTKAEIELGWGCGDVKQALQSYMQHLIAQEKIDRK